MSKPLTPKSVEAFKPDPARRLEIPDPAFPGLYLIMQPTGAKGWALRYRSAGKPAKLTLGRWPIMGLAAARSAASEAAGKLERGEDPAAEKKAAKATEREAPDRDSFRAVVELFARRHASRNRRGSEVIAMFKRELGAWDGKAIQMIGKRDVIEVLDAIVDRGSPITANRLRAHLNTLFGWAKGRDVIQINPLDGIRPPAPEKPRDRVLTDDEVALFWKVTTGMGYPFGPLFKLLLLTGQRLREVAEMTRAEINGNTWILPAKRSKNGDEHTIPLSPEALEIIGELHRIGKGGLLFTTNGETSVSGFTRAKDRLDRLMGEAANDVAGEAVAIPAFTLHDLRRTAATGMAGLRFPPHVVEAVLNHKSGTRRGIASVYNRYDHADEKRQALEAWARHVQALAGRKSDNVVELAGVR